MHELRSRAHDFLGSPGQGEKEQSEEAVTVSTLPSAVLQDPGQDYTPCTTLPNPGLHFKKWSFELFLCASLSRHQILELYLSTSFSTVLMAERFLRLCECGYVCKWHMSKHCECVDMWVHVNMCVSVVVYVRVCGYVCLCGVRVWECLYLIYNYALSDSWARRRENFLEMSGEDAPAHVFIGDSSSVKAWLVYRLLSPAESKSD